jgi:hypothetical protein
MPAILFARSSTFFESQRPPATAEQWRNSAHLQPSPPDTREQTCHSAVCNDRTLTFHTKLFEFGATELAGLKIFLRETSTPPTASPADMAAGLIGNCLACYAAPNFTDFKLHNTGVVQREYDDPLWGQTIYLDHSRRSPSRIWPQERSTTSPQRSNIPAQAIGSDPFPRPTAGTTLTDLGV